VSNIKVCTDENTATPSDIVICDDEQTPKPQDIKVCVDPGRVDPCLTSMDITVSGDGDCNVGDIYSATGGIGPYTWSFDSGGIDSSGEITSINSCVTPGDYRGGVVTATDTCGNSNTLTVRLTGGIWVTVSDPPRGSYFWGVNGTDCAIKFTDAHICAVGSQITINGAIRITEGWNCIDGRSDSELCPLGTPVVSAIADCDLCTTSVYTVPIQSRYLTEEWQCP